MTSTTRPEEITTGPPVPSGAAAGGVLWFLSDAALLTLRTIKHTVRRPDQLMAAVLQPMMFFILFTYVFGGAISVPGNDYKQFVLPGVFGQIVVFGGIAGMCVGIAEDMRNGMMDRFRSLPMHTSAVLLGRTVAEALRNFVAVIVTGAVAYAFGYRLHGSFLQVLGGIGVLVFFGFAVCWVLAVVGVTASSAEGAQTTAMPWVFLFGFVSSAFVPSESMPGWLRPFSDNSPVTLTINTARDLFAGADPGGDATASLLWSAGLLVVFVPLATALFRRATART
ncbi:ABC transporter permease [Kineosporia sp. NBRC 101731]|uniref:ABC transporter permease n=1 Tax=Kineosporia sp. NBRC 101731 TaxID=3032199 RepID=UPI0024A234AE|nr:ABC transporter permease [Kineosporia sp. NBRC 101731]GLY30395.1 transport permease protein [Kineosporia sp. NBRC 101731]